MQRVSAPSENQTHVARLTATRLNHWAIESHRFVSIWQKMVYESSFLATWNRFFACSLRIVVLGLLTAQVGYQVQMLYTRILERKPLIITSYCIQHRLEFHLSWFFLHAHWAAHQPRKLESENWELEILGWSTRSSYAANLCMVGQ